MSDPNENKTLKTPPQWKRPDEVMRMHRLKIKKQSLAARMKSCEPLDAKKKDDDVQPSQSKKVFRNPFKKPLAGTGSNTAVKRLRENEDEDASLDDSLFRLMGIKNPSQATAPDLNFSNLMKKINSSDQEFLDVESKKRKKYIPVDWTLRTKMRLMSPKPFPWNHKLKTCEEASGTTGFVRCLDTQSAKNSACTLDTSPNARFHQCCLVWQYPSLPWLELFPRSAARRSAAATTINFNSHPIAKNALFQEWTESFRSVFQLVRAQQCPYFYLLANSFTVLFRAAGVCGYSEIHAFISPTTRGLRQLLKVEDVEFSMPLKGSGTKSISKRRSGSELDSDNILESTQGLPTDDNDDDVEIEDDNTEDILEKLGVEASDIKKLILPEDETAIQNEASIDGTPESLVCVQGVEAQALFNLLLNCRSTVATIGPLAGVPPTLISPVAFHSAFLRPLKVHESKLRTKDGSSYHSMEICGPILPQMIHNICDLLHVPLSEFSLTFASVESTKAFSLAHSASQEEIVDSHDSPNKSCQSESNHSGVSTPARNNIPSAFGQQNLSDSGLRAAVLKRFCSSKSDDVQSFDSVKFSDGTFQCS